jgi:hypothetical protein
MLKMSACTVDVFTMRLQSPFAFRATHVLAAPFQRFVDADDFPTVASPHFAFVDRLAHAAMLHTRNWVCIIELGRGRRAG